LDCLHDSSKSPIFVNRIGAFSGFGRITPSEL